MNTRSDLSHDFSTTSPDEFLELFKFAGTCDSSTSAPNIDPIKLAFVAILLASFKQWQRHTGFDSEVIQSVQQALRFQKLREELTAVLFNHPPRNLCVAFSSESATIASLHRQLLERSLSQLNLIKESVG